MIGIGSMFLIILIVSVFYKGILLVIVNGIVFCSFIKGIIEIKNVIM